MSYPQFNPPSNYPRPNNNLSNNINLPLPTNSWFQEALVDNIADVDRVGNGTPWYVKPEYSDNNIGLSYGSLLDVTTVRNEGNIILQEAPKNLIDIGVEDSDKLTLDKLTDLTTNFIYSEGAKTTGKCNFARGTPTVNFETVESSIIFKFLSGLTKLEKINNTSYTLDSIVPIQSVLSAELVRDHENTELYRSRSMSFYEGINPLPDSDVEIVLGVQDGSNQISIFYNLYGRQFILIMPIGDKSNAFIQIPGDINPNTGLPVFSYDLQTENNEIGFNITNSLTNEVDNIKVDLTSQISTIIRIVQTPVRWYLYTDASVVLLDQTSSTVRTNQFTGYFRVALAGILIDNGDRLEYFGIKYKSNSTILLDAFEEGVVNNGVVQNFTEDVGNDGKISWGFEYNYTRAGVLFLPPHLVDSGIFTYEGLELHEDNIKWPSLSYGDVKLYRITNNAVKFKSIPIQLCDFPEVDGLLTTNESKELMRELIISDIDRSINMLTEPGTDDVLRTDLNPYTFGTIISSSSRVLYIATKLMNELNIDQDDINKLLVTIRQILKTWLIGTNIGTGGPTYQLQRENKIWGGIIVPADSLNASGIGALSSFDNSFYSDHHFHYGYIVYALSILEELDFGLFSEYPTNVSDLVNDYANPDYNNFTRLRHKDLFYGHSWATGVVGLPTKLPGTEGAGPVNRQQESSGEAINSYFAAYLLGKTTKNNLLRILSGVGFILEIAAARSYYMYDSPNSRVGDLINTGSIGIMQTEGKSFTLDWPMEPPTFPGRSFGIYGIQALPFTEATGIYLPSSITTPFTPNSRYIQNMADNGMGVGIVESVLNRTYMAFPPGQLNNERITYGQNGGTKWGNVALELLAFNSDVASDSIIQELFGLLINRRNEDPTKELLKEFDSFTNTYYMLLKLRGTGITPNSVCYGQKWNNLVRKKCKIHHKHNINKSTNMSNIRGVTTMAKINVKDTVNDGKQKKLTYNIDIESNVSSSMESKNNKEFSRSEKSFDHSKCKTKLNKYKSLYRYKCRLFTGELTVIHGKCALLKFVFDDKSIKIINKEKLPYKFPMMTKNETDNYKNNEKCYCEKISKYIMYNHANKLNKISETFGHKYIDSQDYKDYISQYEKVY